MSEISAHFPPDKSTDDAATSTKHAVLRPNARMITRKIAIDSSFGGASLNIPFRVPGILIVGLFHVIVSGTAAADERPKPMKVFILAGQSNMQGHASLSTLDSMADDPKTAPLLKAMLDADGKPRVCEKVWISSVGCRGDAYSDLTEHKGKLTIGF